MNIQYFAITKEKTQRNKIKQLTKLTEFIPVFAEDDYSRTDGQIVNYITNQHYSFESKWYGDINHPRYSDKFRNYQIDYEKLSALEAKSKEENSTPLLICFFSNELVVWNINKCNWKDTKKTVRTNKYGGAYGYEKEYAEQAYLFLDDAIYRNKNITPFN
jgi:hypothetical protein